MGKFFFIIAVISTIVGLLLLFAPRVLEQFGRMVNRFYITDDVIFAKRFTFGIFLLLASMVMIYTYMFLHNNYVFVR